MPSQTELSILIKLRDEASRRMSGIFKNLDKFQKKMERSARASRGFGIALGVGVAAVGTGLGFMIKAAADLEQTQIAFETMLGSADKAKVFLKDLTDFAAKTPFELKGVEEAAKKLLAFGIDSENILPDLKSLGDIAAGVGTEKLPFLINAFGQVRAKGRLMGQELLQFTEAGVPLAEELAKSFGKTTAEIQEMISKGQIGFKDVRQVLGDMTTEGGRFNDLMDAQSESLNGMISNLGDAWQKFLRGEGEGLIKWAKKFVELAIDIVENHLPAWIEKIQEVVTFFKEHKEVIIIIAGVILGALVPAILTAVMSFGALLLAMAPFLIGGAIIGGLIAGIYLIIKHWDAIKAKAIAVWGAISNFFQKIWDHITEVSKSAWQAISDFFTEIWEGIKETLEDSLNFIIGLIALVLDALIPDWQEKLAVIFSIWESVWEAIKKTVTIIFNSIKNFIGSRLDEIQTVWEAVWDAVSSFFTDIWENIKNSLTAAIDFIKDKLEGLRVFVDNLMDKVTSVINKVKGAFGAVGGIVGGAVSQVSGRGAQITGLQHGGIVTRPTVAMVGEAGPEAVIPLRRGGIGATVNIHIHGNVFGEQEFMEIVEQGLKRRVVTSRAGLI